MYGYIGLYIVRDIPGYIEDISGYVGTRTWDFAVGVRIQGFRVLRFGFIPRPPKCPL